MKRGTRRPRSPISRVRPFWLLGAFAGAIVAAAVYWALTWPGFDAAHVLITGNRIVPAREVLQRAGVALHRNIWLQNTGAIATRVKAIPYVADVHVYRSLPANIHIAVTERRPFARIGYAGTNAIVDREFRVLEYTKDETALPLLVPMHAADAPQPGSFIHDPAVLRLQKDFDILRNARVTATSVRYDRFGDLVAVDREHVVLLFGDDDDLTKKAALVAPILSQVPAKGRRIAALDLRAPATPVVRYR